MCYNVHDSLEEFCMFLHESDKTHILSMWEGGEDDAACQRSRIPVRGPDFLGGSGWDSK